MEQIPHPDGALLLGTAGLQGVSGAQVSTLQSGGGGRPIQRPEDGAGAEGARAGLLTLTSGGRRMGWGAWRCFETVGKSPSHSGLLSLL